MVTQRKCGYPIPPLELPEAKFNGALDPLVQWVEPTYGRILELGGLLRSRHSIVLLYGTAVSECNQCSSFCPVS